ncbi:helix-turn-helix domain-containing protein [Treponema primitia]|uniref:helix-turn-helix domain-containing protein n=1 Tax=Treponema primitia TaxID=88058 RepID=UPI0002555859|nr:helix-turn-helix transcriptional regulator [Treponema primitia]
MKYNNFDSFGMLCKLYRTQKKWTQAEAGKVLGFDQTTISGIEKEKIPPSSRFLKSCIEKYKLKNIDKIRFIAKAYTASKEITLTVENEILVRKEDVAWLFAILSVSPDEFNAIQELESSSLVIRLKSDIENLKSIIMK